MRVECPSYEDVCRQQGRTYARSGQNSSTTKTGLPFAAMAISPAARQTHPSWQNPPAKPLDHRRRWTHVLCAAVYAKLIIRPTKALGGVGPRYSGRCSSSIIQQPRAVSARANFLRAQRSIRGRYHSGAQPTESVIEESKKDPPKCPEIQGLYPRCTAARPRISAFPACKKQAEIRLLQVNKRCLFPTTCQNIGGRTTRINTSNCCVSCAQHRGRERKGVRSALVCATIYHDGQRRNDCVLPRTGRDHHISGQPRKVAPEQHERQRPGTNMWQSPFLSKV